MDYKLGLYEKAMPGGLSWREMLESTREADFDHLEISVDESDARQARLAWSAGERRKLAELSRELAMPIRSMCLSGHRKYPLGSHDAQIRARGMQIMREAVRLAGDLGVRVIQLAGYDVYYEEGDNQTRAWFAENLHASVEYAAQFGVNLGFETMETPFMDTVGKGMRYVREVNSAYLGMYPDLGNLTNAAYLHGQDVLEDIRTGAGHIFAMHLKETKEGLYRDMDFGTGRVDFVAGIRQALDIGVRMFVAEFWHDGSADWKSRLKRTNRFIRERFEQAVAN